MSHVAAPTAVRFEHRTDEDPVLGIGTATPRLSWIVPAADAAFVQEAYEVELTRAGRTPEVVPVTSREQVLVPWPAAPLTSRESARVRVRVSGAGMQSAWSDPATVEAGLLRTEDWTARFISPRELGGLGAPAPVLRSAFDLPDGVVKARLYATAHGLYEARLNGHRVGDEVLAPGWTSYTHRLRYQTYDVTDLVREGGNDLEMLLGNGWYRGRLGFRGRRGVYGDRLALLAQLEVTTSDGAVHVLGTDASWAVRESGVLADHLYDGERTDSPPGRMIGGAVEGRPGPGPLVPPRPAGAGHRDTARGAAQVAVRRTMVDFGQNLVGRLRCGSRGRPRVVIRHAEVLEDGELGPGRCGTPRPPTATSWRRGSEELEPRFTFHGFRYAEIEGCPGSSRGVERSCCTDMRRTGWFALPPALNRLHENVVWGMRGNFLAVPTDCPQRDERLGWTGDIQVFAPTASYLYDCDAFLTSWLEDLAPIRRADGSCRSSYPTSSGRGRGRRLGRCRDAGALGAPRAIRRPRGRAAAVPEHEGVGRRGHLTRWGLSCSGRAASSSVTGSTLMPRP